jgi:hypothetical protein
VIRGPNTRRSYIGNSAHWRLASNSQQRRSQALCATHSGDNGFLRRRCPWKATGRDGPNFG